MKCHENQNVLLKLIIFLLRINYTPILNLSIKLLMDKNRKVRNNI